MNTIYFTTVPSPIGDLTLTATSIGICGLYFEDHKYWPASRPSWRRDDGKHFDAARSWLESYFAGENSKNLPEVDVVNGTEFQQRIWKVLRGIPPGQTRTYASIAQSAGSPKAVRAVGAAIGRNPISIIVPCHRVIGSDGALTGFAGGVERKRWLLAHEGSLL
ncbi:MAG: methylated-DNA--[protein]-cysteine S-methyltransferase [Verrucomicrobiaceae bacterium]|nr:methylated-DNA--[protein]-cysteine S-methyltransferase [Verrucomicrobiaceae bacterium]